MGRIPGKRHIIERAMSNQISWGGIKSHADPMRKLAAEIDGPLSKVEIGVRKLTWMVGFLFVLVFLLMIGHFGL